MRQKSPFFSILVVVTFFLTSLGVTGQAFGGELVLPKPGVMVALSKNFQAPTLKGIRVNPKNPLHFDFILDKGESNLDQVSLKDETTQLVKYFLASLTTPEKDLWVNLSPYEKERIVPESFGQTTMGRDLLAQDYLLKQITASLVYPEGDIGKSFWKRVYEQSANKNTPINTFNKVWIVPDKAVVYENLPAGQAGAKAGTAFVAEASLKVMTEIDYLATSKNLTQTRGHVSSETCPQAGCQANTRLSAKATEGTNLTQNIIRDIVIPELNKEVNEGANFARLRQVYSAYILAAWYKKKIKDSLLSQVYQDQNKIAGVNIDNPQEKQLIYERYLQAFKKGVYDYVKEDVDAGTQQVIPRKYFSGGVDFAQAVVTIQDASRATGAGTTVANAAKEAIREIMDGKRIVEADVNLAVQGPDNARPQTTKFFYTPDDVKAILKDNNFDAKAIWEALKREGVVSIDPFYDRKNYKKMKEGERRDKFVSALMILYPKAKYPDYNIVAVEIKYIQKIVEDYLLGNVNPLVRNKLMDFFTNLFQHKIAQGTKFTIKSAPSVPMFAELLANNPNQEVEAITGELIENYTDEKGVTHEVATFSLSFYIHENKVALGRLVSREIGVEPVLIVQQYLNGNYDPVITQEAFATFKQTLSDIFQGHDVDIDLNNEYILQKQLAESAKGLTKTQIQYAFKIAQRGGAVTLENFRKALEFQAKNLTPSQVYPSNQQNAVFAKANGRLLDVLKWMGFTEAWLDVAMPDGLPNAMLYGRMGYRFIFDDNPDQKMQEILASMQEDYKKIRTEPLLSWSIFKDDMTEEQWLDLNFSLIGKEWVKAISSNEIRISTSKSEKDFIGELEKNKEGQLLQIVELKKIQDKRDAKDIAWEMLKKYPHMIYKMSILLAGSPEPTVPMTDSQLSERVDTLASAAMTAEDAAMTTSTALRIQRDFNKYLENSPGRLFGLLIRASKSAKDFSISFSPRSISEENSLKLQKLGLVDKLPDGAIQARTTNMLPKILAKNGLSDWEDVINKPYQANFYSDGVNLGSVHLTKEERELIGKAGEDKRKIIRVLQGLLLLRSAMNTIKGVQASFDSKQNAIRNPGGIDLKPERLDLNVQNQNGEINFKLDPAMIAKFKDAAGFEPIVLEMKPINDINALNTFLGVSR